MKNDKEQPETVEQAAAKFCQNRSIDPTREEIFMAGFKHASQHSYTEQKWISVEEDMLPPFEVKQMIILENGETHLGYYNGADTRGDCWFCDNNDYHYPTHWMPLPKSPTEQAALGTTDIRYTQEQPLAFGEDLIKRFNELALHERSWSENEREAFPKGTDGTQDAWLHAYGLGITKAQKLFEQTLIDISKLLKK